MQQIRDREKERPQFGGPVNPYGPKAPSWDQTAVSGVDSVRGQRVFLRAKDSVGNEFPYAWDCSSEHNANAVADVLRQNIGKSIGDIVQFQIDAE